MLSVKEVANMIDHTNLKPYATGEDFRKLCDEAVEYGFKSVAINTYPVAMCREMLAGSEVLTGAAVGLVSARPDDDRDEGCGSGKCDQ